MDTQVKERLTGAIILVALIVLLVPELLSGPVRTPSTVPPAAANAAEEAQVRTVKIEIPDEHVRTAGPEPLPETGAARPMAPAEPVQPAPGAARSAARTPAAGNPPASVPAPAPAPTPAPAPATREAHPAAHEPPAAHTEAHASPKGSWVVQLGSFASRENAERLATKLRAQGFKASVTPSTGKGRSLWRVRAGAPGERAAAEQLAGQVRAAGHSVSIVAK